MARDDERLERSQEEPIVGGLPDVPGIGAAMRLTPGLGVHLRGLADELLVNDFPGATIRRDEREMLATAVSAANDCFFCMDSHGAYADGPAGAKRRRPGSSRSIDVIKTRLVGWPRPQDAGAAPHRPDGPARASRADGDGRGRGPGCRSNRCGRPAGRPHRGGVLDVQPDGRWLPRYDAADHRGVPERARPRSPSTATATNGSPPFLDVHDPAATDGGPGGTVGAAPRTRRAGSRRGGPRGSIRGRSGRSPRSPGSA